MNWLRRLLTPRHRRRLPAGASPEASNRALDGPWVAAGLHTRRVEGKPRLTAISAVVVEQGRLHAGRRFHARLCGGLMPAALPDAQRTRLGNDWREFLGDCPLVSFGGAERLRALSDSLGLPRHLATLELSRLLPGLYPGTSPDDELGTWLARVGLPRVESGDADALALAHGKLLLVALQRAQRQQIHDLRGLRKACA